MKCKKAGVEISMIHAAIARIIFALYSALSQQFPLNMNQQMPYTNLLTCVRGAENSVFQYVNLPTDATLCVHQ